MKDPISNCGVDKFQKKKTIVSWSGDCRDGKADGVGVLAWIKTANLPGGTRGPCSAGRRKASALPTCG